MYVCIYICMYVCMYVYVYIILPLPYEYTPFPFVLSTKGNSLHDGVPKTCSLLAAPYASALVHACMYVCMYVLYMYAYIRKRALFW